MTPRDRYESRVADFEAELALIARAARRISHLRVLAFLAFLTLLVVAFDLRSTLAAGTAVLALAGFLVLVVQHARLRREEARLKTFVLLNREGLQRLERNWAALPSRPALSDVRSHAYGDDLDLFGTASLSQLLGRTGTIVGQRILEDWLLEPADPDTVRRRQQAVRELAGLIDWRDTLAHFARQTTSLRPDELAAFLNWAESPGWFSQRRLLQVVAWLLPLVTWSLLLLDIWLPTTRWWIFSVFVTFLISLRVLPRVHRTFSQASARASLLAHYPDLLRCSVAAEFHADLLRELHGRLHTEGVSAYYALRALDRLLHLSDLRLSSLHPPIQWLTLSDLHLLRALESWQHRYGSRARDWLNALGELEALAALSTLAHDHPEWTYPALVEAAETIQAEALGHPLLAEGKRVDNDVVLGPAGGFLFVTGSNMSGKSTLLRAMGINIVLAQAGAPVCARAFQLPRVRLRTAIRVQDSLARGVSYFMAELERLRSIADAAAQRSDSQTVVFLLDEVLHGTNSAERRIAARLVIRRLVDLGALGAVTSHDLDLASGGELNGLAQPVHFREHFREENGHTTMEFDYLLRPGVATTTNALRLVELMGLAPRAT